MSDESLSLLDIPSEERVSVSESQSADPQQLKGQTDTQMTELVKSPVRMTENQETNEEAGTHWTVPLPVALQYFRGKYLQQAQSQRSFRNLWGCCIRRSSHAAKAFNELRLLTEVCYDPSDRFHVAILETALFLLTGKRLNQVNIRSSFTFMTKGLHLSISLQETLRHPGAMVNLLFLLYMEEFLQEECHILIARIQSSEVGEVPLLPFLIQANASFWNYLRRYRVKIDSEDAVLGIFELSVGWLKAWADEYSNKDIHWDDYTWLREFLRQQAKALK